LEGKPTQAFYRDTELTGFGLKITSAGTKTYIVEARVQGKPKRMTIGKHGALAPEQARKQAQRLIGEIAVGRNPATEKREQLVRVVTLGEVFNNYLKTRKDLKPNTVIDYKKCIEGYLKDWLDKPMLGITKEMVEARHLKLGSSSPARANNAMRVLRALFNY